ncbi:MAG: hypothetical protein E4H14_18130 [Candidatus Thorarchaeota archaeon]|nr:MAG: hypothetical protein E4H14_18130 [Candidatus Thorarchaeota archaeon]
MSGTKEFPIKGAAIFALGMAILLFSIYTVVMSAAYEIGYSPMYVDTYSYNMSMALGGAISGGIGSLLIFIGWRAE